MKRSIVPIGLVAACVFALSGYAWAGARSGFSGRVVQVNTPSETFSVRGGQNMITFDASNPVLSGYRALSDMRVGDRVAVSYTPDGIRVARLMEGSRGAPGEPGRKAVGAEPQKGQPRLSRLLRRVPRSTGSGFDDVDANKDGKITPVELSTVIPDITLDRFREQDTNRDGFLNRAEFARAVKQPKAR